LKQYVSPGEDSLASINFPEDDPFGRDSPVPGLGRSVGGLDSCRPFSISFDLSPRVQEIGLAEPTGNGHLDIFIGDEQEGQI
jgi:hypothetical protein